MKAERAEVVAAIDSSPNLNVAASRLSTSRKTLFNRMREFHLPPGKSGRPREELEISGEDDIGALVLLGALGLGAWWWFKQRKTTVAGERLNDLRGLDIVSRR